MLSVGNGGELGGGCLSGDGWVRLGVVRKAVGDEGVRGVGKGLTQLMPEADEPPLTP